MKMQRRILAVGINRIFTGSHKRKERPSCTFKTPETFSPTFPPKINGRKDSGLKTERRHDLLLPEIESMVIPAPAAVNTETGQTYKI